MTHRHDARSDPAMSNTRSPEPGRVNASLRSRGANGSDDRRPSAKLARRRLLQHSLAIAPLLLAACGAPSTVGPTTDPTGIPTATLPTPAPAATGAPSPASPTLAQGTASPTSAPASPGSPTTVASAPTSAPAATGCVLSPEQSEGPYYLARELIRADVTEGRPGTPLRLALTVQRAGTCQPIQGVMVEIWHCDAAGVYSAFGGADGETFLRGGQVADANGAVAFQTIYPGWYPGRAVHIHVKVSTDERSVYTGQLYFDEVISDAIYAQQPYAARPNRSTRNTNDGLFQRGGEQSIVAVTQADGGYHGTQTLVVDT